MIHNLQQLDYVILLGTMTVVSKKFSIPVGADGEIVVPDLSMFHSLIQSRTDRAHCIVPILRNPATESLFQAEIRDISKELCRRCRHGRR